MYRPKQKLVLLINWYDPESGRYLSAGILPSGMRISAALTQKPAMQHLTAGLSGGEAVFIRALESNLHKTIRKSCLFCCH